MNKEEEFILKKWVTFNHVRENVYYSLNKNALRIGILVMAVAIVADMLHFHKFNRKTEQNYTVKLNHMGSMK